MKKIIIVQIILSLIFVVAFTTGNQYNCFDGLIPAMQRDNSFANIAHTAIETMRNIGTGR